MPQLPKDAAGSAPPTSTATARLAIWVMLACVASLPSASISRTEEHSAKGPNQNVNLGGLWTGPSIFTGTKKISLDLGDPETARAGRFPPRCAPEGAANRSATSHCWQTEQWD